MKMYASFLKNTCNPTAGYRLWWIVGIIGIVLMVAWVAAALPWVGAFIGLNSLGKFEINHYHSIVAYGNLQIFEPKASYYFFMVLFGIAIAKLGYLLFLLGMNYGKGCRYMGSGRWSAPIKLTLLFLFSAGLNSSAFAQTCQHKGWANWQYFISGKQAGMSRWSHPIPDEVFADLAPFFRDAEKIEVYNVPKMETPDTNRVHNYTIEGRRVFSTSNKLDWVVIVTLDTCRVRVSPDTIVIGLLSYSVERQYEAYFVPAGYDFRIGKFEITNLGYEMLNLSKGDRAWASKNRHLKWGWTRDPKDVRGEALADSVSKLVKTLKRLARAGEYGAFSYDVYNSGRDTVFVVAFVDSTYYLSRTVKRIVHYEIEYHQFGRYLKIRSAKEREFYSGRVEPGVYQEWAMTKVGTGENLTLHYPLPYWDKRLFTDLTESGRIDLLEEVLVAISRCCPKTE